MILKVSKFQQCVKGQAETAVARTILATFMAREFEQGVGPGVQRRSYEKTRSRERERGAGLTESSMQFSVPHQQLLHQDTNREEVLFPDSKRHNGPQGGHPGHL